MQRQILILAPSANTLPPRLVSKENTATAMLSQTIQSIKQETKKTKENKGQKLYI